MSRPSATSRANARKLTQLAVAAPQVVAHRLTRMALAGAHPDARDRQEWTRMVVEKQLAFTQAWWGMGWALAWGMARWQQRGFTAWLTGRAVLPGLPRATLDSVIAKGIGPVHRRAVANSKRLARPRRR